MIRNDDDDEEEAGGDDEDDITWEPQQENDALELDKYPLEVKPTITEIVPNFGWLKFPT